MTGDYVGNPMEGGRPKHSYLSIITVKAISKITGSPTATATTYREFLRFADIYRSYTAGLAYYIRYG